MSAGSAPSRPTPHWAAALGQRIATLWVLKMFGTMAWIAVFFVLYFGVMRHPLGIPLVMPITAFDLWLDPRPWAVWPYISLWLYVGLAPAFAASGAELRAYIPRALLLSLGGLAIFWLWPTEVPHFLPAEALHDPSMQFLKSRDQAGNAFPSLHVAFALFSGLLIARQLRAVGAPPAVHVFNVLWLLAIVYSTLATRQHVVIDVLGGLAFGTLACLPARWRFRPPAPGAPHAGAAPAQRRP